MKNTLLTTLFLALALAAAAQSSVKKYVLIEHFTNSRCSVCASRNPGFYNLIGQSQNAESIHHVAVHPSIPYVNCEFHQYNTADNTARHSFYPGIVSTPRLVLNGALIAGANPLLSQSVLDGYLNQTSPLYVRVNENASGSTVNVSVDLKSYGAPPAGNYKLTVILMEKLLNKLTPNGETVHHDVLRKIISNNTVTLPNINVTDTYAFSYSTAGLDPSQTYVVAFVQNQSTKEVLNSGTKFDNTILTDKEPLVEQVKVSPNPASDVVRFEMPESLTVDRLLVFDAKGQAIRRDFTLDGATISLPVADLAAGIYFAWFEANGVAFFKKFVKN